MSMCNTGGSGCACTRRAASATRCPAIIALRHTCTAISTGLSQTLSVGRGTAGLVWFSGWVPFGRSDPVRALSRPLPNFATGPRALLAVKDRLGHGSFDHWLRVEFGQKALHGIVPHASCCGTLRVEIRYGIGFASRDGPQDGGQAHA